ncbi:MAG: hypothetical protein LUO79_08300 [Methanomassiliicoccales archaeon]|nr:hypothetical protein [Methanomassiliicoccales archaeon]
MRAAVILDLDDVKFIEPNYERLADNSYTARLISTKAEEARMLISEDEWPLAVALKTATGWIAGSFILRKPTEAVIDKVESLEGDVLQDERSEWEGAVREYYSLGLLATVQPAVEDFNPARMKSVADLVKERWGQIEGEACLDACCGSGAGSAALRSIGMLPMAYDNDPALLSLGMRAGRLSPEDTVCIDGLKASKLLRPTHFGLMLMAGEVHPHNQIIWKLLVEELLALTENTLITTGTEREAKLIADWARDRGRKVEALENEREAFYDNWVCDIKKA